MYQYYNANPLGRHVSDCSVRAISLATKKSWDETYVILADFARREGITFSEIEFINEYLAERYERFCPENQIVQLKDFLKLNAFVKTYFF